MILTLCRWGSKVTQAGSYLCAWGVLNKSSMEREFRFKVDSIKTSLGVIMLGKVSNYTGFFVVLFAILGSTQVSAQKVEASIVGFWQQQNDSVYIEITESDGVLLAEMIRNDWNPALVGKTIWTDLKTEDNKKWVGVVINNKPNSTSDSNSKASKITLRLRRGTQLSSLQKPGKHPRIKWVRSEKVKKGY